MPKQEVTRTPDKIKGLERASQALARVFDYNLARQQQQERQQQVLQQIQQEQQFKQALQQQEIEAAGQRLNKDLTFRREVEDRLREKAEEERRLRNLERRSRDMFKTEELSLRRREIEALNRLRQAQALSYSRTTKEESLSQSISERIKQLNALSYFPDTPSAQMRTQMIISELRPLQKALDTVRAGGNIPANLGGNLGKAERVGFREYLRTTGLPIPPESVYEKAPTTQQLKQVAQGETKTQNRQAEAKEFLKQNGLPITDANIKYYLENAK